MNALEFWTLMDHSRSGAAREKDDVALAALTSRLAGLDAAEIASFDAAFRDQIGTLDTSDIRDVANQLWVLSDDTWLHFRAWCVSKGREFVEQVRKHPATLRAVAAAHGGPFDMPSGEVFLFCGEYARVTREFAAAS